MSQCKPPSVIWAANSEFNPRRMTESESSPSFDWGFESWKVRVADHPASIGVCPTVRIRTATSGFAQACLALSAPCAKVVFVLPFPRTEPHLHGLRCLRPEGTPYEQPDGRFSLRLAHSVEKASIYTHCCPDTGARYRSEHGRLQSCEIHFLCVGSRFAIPKNWYLSAIASQIIPLDLDSI